MKIRKNALTLVLAASGCLIGEAVSAVELPQQMLPKYDVSANINRAMFNQKQTVFKISQNTVTESAGTWDKTKDVSNDTWKATKDGTAKAGDAVAEKSGDAWEATKEGTAKAWDKTKDVSSDAWEATKDGTAKAGDTVAEKSGDAWEATKEGTAKAWDKTKEALSGD